MDLYHSWFYEYILNTPYFLWTVVVFVFGFNFLGPVLVWFVMNSKSIPLLHRIGKEKNTKKANNAQSE